MFNQVLGPLLIFFEDLVEIFVFQHSLPLNRYRRARICGGLSVGIVLQHRSSGVLDTAELDVGFGYRVTRVPVLASLVEKVGGRVHCDRDVLVHYKFKCIFVILNLESMELTWFVILGHLRSVLGR